MHLQERRETPSQHVINCTECFRGDRVSFVTEFSAANKKKEEFLKKKQKDKRELLAMRLNQISYENFVYEVSVENYAKFVIKVRLNFWNLNCIFLHGSSNCSSSSDSGVESREFQSQQQLQLLPDVTPNQTPFMQNCG